MSKPVCGAALLVICLCQEATGEAFLGGRSSSRLDQDDAFRAAMSSVMGCGGGVAQERLPFIESALAATWRTLPKNSEGRIEWRMLRYMVHRHFMQQSSLLIRGLERTRVVNASHLGSANILNEQAAQLIEPVLQKKHQTTGFTLHDAAIMVATLEQLIFDAESALLETVYKQQRRSTKVSLGRMDLEEILEAYMVHWMLANDPVMGGQSTGTFTIANGVGVFDGSVVDVPFLKAPGFIKAVTTDNKAFPDVTYCKAIELTAKADAAYAGYRLSLGNAHAPHGKVFAYGYKSHFVPPVGEFGTVTIPFANFSDYWDDATGEPIKTCQDDKVYCLDATTLKNMETLSVWAEGVKGKVHLEIKSIEASAPPVT